MSKIHDAEKALPPQSDNGQDDSIKSPKINDMTFNHPISQQTTREERQEPEEEITHLPTHSTHSTTTRPKNPIIKLAKTITARSNASIIDPGPPPDGGRKAWTQSVMGHLVILNTWGMISTFGVFQQYYTNTLSLEHSAVSWIGSMQMLGHFSLGMFTGRMLDAGYFHWAVVPGMLCSALGIMLTSLCTKYWQLFLAQGVLNGIGNGMQFAPTLSLVSTYFARNRVVALAIMASGSATGGIIYPTIARALLPAVGFAWTVRVMGFMMLAIGVVYSALLRPRLPPRRSGPLFELSAFREPPYSLFLLAVFMISLGQYFAFYYIPSFATEVLGVPYGTAIYVLLALNGIGFFGRLIPSFFADRWFGCYNMLIPFCFASAIILFFWPLVKSTGGLYGWSLSYGFFVAGFQGMFPAVLTSLTKDMSRVGTRNGMGLAIVGVGTLIGPPIAGALIESYHEDYLVAQMFGGTAVFLGSCMLIVGRISKTGRVLMVRA